MKFMPVAAVSTVRARPDDMAMFVNYHLNTGIDRLYLFFDDPGDPSVERFQGDRRITTIRCDSTHWTASDLGDNPSIERRQIHNANLAFSLAREEGVSWLIHIDSDELIFTPGSNMGQYLKGYARDWDAVRFPALEAVPKAAYQGHPFEEINWFKTDDSYLPGAKRIARLLGCRRVFESGYLKAHVAGKTAVRVDSSIDSMGIHSPIPREGTQFRIVKSPDAFLLHFDCCTIDDWMTKWKRRLDGTGTAANMREDRKRQYAEFAAAYQSGSDAGLVSAYRRQYSISAGQKIVLAALGLMRRIKLDGGCFVDARTPAN